MKKALPISLVLLLGFSLTLLGAEGGSVPFTDDTGKIRVPEDYTSWEFLGAWSIAAKGDDAKGAKELHNVYASKGTIEAFRKTGQFPDKAVLVKEILTTETGRLTTGTASWATEYKGWFVMIKDTEGRFPDNKLWGGGWGWAWFDADDRENPVTKNYKTECISCHIPAKDDDWIYLRGYPVLQK
jgi:hypothetical protein